MISNPYQYYTDFKSMFFMVGIACDPNVKRTTFSVALFFISTNILSKLSPNHLIYNASVGLDDFNYLGGNVFLNVVRHGDAVITVLGHLNGGVNRL